MPLSKRINNLHINNTYQNSSDEQAPSTSQLSAPNSIISHQDHNQHHQFIPRDDIDMLQQQPQLHPHDPLNHQHQQQFQSNSDPHHNSQAANHSAFAASPQSHHANTMPMIEPYAPDLSSEENPFYYSKNKLLYDLHAARMQRNN